VGWQVHGLKRPVFRPVRNSLYVREVLGIDFLREPKYSYNCLRLLVWPIVEALEGKWGIRRTVEKRRGTLTGVGQSCGE
jgi:hypothetical protein